MTDSTAPSPPALSYVKVLSASVVDLRWEVPFDAVGVTAYKVYLDGNSIITLGAAPWYTDTGRAANTAYKYEITALDAALNESNKSNAVTVTTQVDPNAAATVTASALAKDHGFAEVDFGSTPVPDGIFTIMDTDVSPNSRITVQMSYMAPTGKDRDEMEMDDVVFRVVPGSGQFSVYAHAPDGSYLADKFMINYVVM